MKATEIIKLAKKLKKRVNDVNDPGYICENLNIPIRKFKLNPKVYPAYTTTDINGEPIISLNVHYSLRSQSVLCAHELGHAVLHKDNYYNGFDGDNLKQEYEANLFAVVILFSEEQISQLDVSLEKMSDFELKCILDYNIKLLPNGNLDYRYFETYSIQGGVNNENSNLFS